MNVAASDLPLLVAPRPVRISSGHFTRAHPVRFVSPPSEQFDRLKLTDERDTDDHRLGLYADSSPVSDKDLSSPRSSSCSGLPSEALEEFLSILRPTFFRPTSPRLRARLQSSTISLPNFPYERSNSFKGRTRLELVQKSDSNSLLAFEDVDHTRLIPPDGDTSPDTSDPAMEGNFEFDADNHAVRWRISHHSSPISRMQTRNPFQRHPSYEMGAPQFGHSPIPPSPAAIPLPLPTPDELVEMT